MKKNYSLCNNNYKYKKKYYRLLILFIILIASIFIYVYLNYDYLAFKHFIAQNYIYTDTLDELYEEKLEQDINGKYYSYFDDLVISIVTDEIREKNNDKYTYLYIPEKLELHKKIEKEDALESYVEEIVDDVLYVKITNFSKYTKDFLYDNKKTLKQYPNIIIDLRDNYGGDIFAMNSMTDMFLSRNKVISKDIMRIFNWTHKTYKSQILKYDNIIILQNANSASASENFIIALKENLDNVTLIGKKTYGKGIGQYTLPLKKGFAVKATTMQWFSPLGNNIHTVGIPPDFEYEKEDIIDFAVNMISKELKTGN